MKKILLLAGLISSLSSPFAFAYNASPTGANIKISVTQKQSIQENQKKDEKSQENEDTKTVDLIYEMSPSKNANVIYSDKELTILGTIKMNEHGNGDYDLKIINVENNEYITPIGGFNMKKDDDRVIFNVENKNIKVRINYRAIGGR